MNVVFIDTNIYNEDGTYYIDDIVVKGKNLNIGEFVTAYQDDEEWDAQISYDGNNWGVKLLSDARCISNDRKIGHQEGFWEGYYCRLRELSKVLGQVGIDKKTIQVILNRFLAIYSE